MIRVYNHNSTYRLEALDGTVKIVRPNNFDEIDEKYTGDITYKMAIAAGDIEVFDDTKQGDNIEKAAHEADKPVRGSKKASDAK